MVIWNGLAQLWRSENLARGYREVRTPILYDAELWKQSGHWDKYRDNMYFTEVEERPMGLKPMNCPAHIQLYKDARRSYRDLPIRYSEAGLVHRHEPSGTLHGLLRVRHITQDDAHIFCTEEQIQDEVDRLPGLRLLPLPHVRLRAAAGALDAARRSGSAPTRCGTAPRRRSRARCAAQGLEFELNAGDGAFYGPKIDLHMTDSIGRSWQLGTVQLDYSMPERFELAYTGADNDEHRPVMIHRALIGSFERFIGILIEHYAGEFPLWLAPLQALVLPVADRHIDYASEVVGAARRGRAARARSTTAASRSGARSATPSWPRCRTCSWSATARPRPARAALRRHGEGDLGTLALDEIAARLGGRGRRAPCSGVTPRGLTAAAALALSFAPTLMRRARGASSSP